MAYFAYSSLRGGLEAPSADAKRQSLVFDETAGGIHSFTFAIYPYPSSL